MEYVKMYWSFVLVTSYLVKKVPMEKESNIILGVTIILLALFAHKSSEYKLDNMKPS